MPAIVTFRPFYDLLTDVQALDKKQQEAIWADLSAGDPPRVFGGGTHSRGGIAALHWAATQSPGTGGPQASARAYLIALYCQDHRDYLVRPAFDPTINVPGSVVVG
jgi:hypothetical protein